MTDKFKEYYSNEDRIVDFSEYVHLNMKLIMTKMVSEMRRKLDISPDMQNSEGYVSLMVSLYGRIFNEVVYSTCGLCESAKINLTQMLPPLTLSMILDLMMGVNPLNGKLRDDIPNDLPKFQRFYEKNIRTLRQAIEALPKEN